MLVHRLTRQDEKILNDPGQALGFVFDKRERLFVVLGVSILFQRHLSFATQNRQRRPQFMRRVGDESLLFAEGRVQPRQQSIDGCGELSQFIARIRHIKSR